MISSDDAAKIPRWRTALRWSRTSCRAAHIAVFSALVGGHVFDQPESALFPWLIATVATGLGLVATDLVGGLGWMVELRGLAVAFKILLLLAIPLFWDDRVAILMFVIVMAGIVSHMPGRYRYYVPGRGVRTGSTGNG